MAITQQQIEEVVAEAKRLVAAGSRAEMEKRLRLAFPDLRLALCSENDVTTPPVREEADFDVHLIGGDGHCLALTRNTAAALGVVLALREE